MLKAQFLKSFKIFKALYQKCSKIAFYGNFGWTYFCVNNIVQNDFNKSARNGAKRIVILNTKNSKPQKYDSLQKPPK